MHIQKQLVETSAGKLQYSISGSGSPPVVLINGGSGPIEGWMKILPETAKQSSVFAYNRFGVAGSDKPQTAQDGRTIVENLREALKLAGCEPPYLLVGHSLGGLYANLFARLYPDETAGILFLESSHPHDTTLNQHQGKTVKTINKLFSMFDSFSSWKQFGEVNFVEQTISQIQQANAFPDIPVSVITGMKKSRMVPEAFRQKRLEHQLELLSLSQNSKHIAAGKSGHFPQLSDPEIVVDAVKELLQIRQGEG